MLPVDVRETDSVKQVAAKVLQLLGLDEKGIVLQLRNRRGSLIPMNGRLQKNTRDTPYSLDVLLEYQRVTPKPRSVKSKIYTATALTQIQNIMQRINMLEENIPQLRNRREEKIKYELEELDRKLNFLRKRFQDADQSTWTGIIKKSPLW